MARYAGPPPQIRELLYINSDPPAEKIGLFETPGTRASQMMEFDPPPESAGAAKITGFMMLNSIYESKNTVLINFFSKR